MSIVFLERPKFFIHKKRIIFSEVIKVKELMSIRFFRQYWNTNIKSIRVNDINQPHSGGKKPTCPVLI